MIVNLSTASTLVTPAATAWRAADAAMPANDAAMAPATASAPASSAVSVSLGQAGASADAQTYPPPARTVPVWAQRSDDAISALMAGNIAHGSFSTRLDAFNGLNGLGAAMLKRFGTEAGDFSQSVTLAAPGASAVGASDLYASADNQIKLSIRTATGATVELALGSQDGGLAPATTAC